MDCVFVKQAPLLTIVIFEVIDELHDVGPDVKCAVSTSSPYLAIHNLQQVRTSWTTYQWHIACCFILNRINQHLENLA